MVVTAVMGTLLSNSSKVRRSLPVKTGRRGYSSRCTEKVHGKSPVLHWFLTGAITTQYGTSVFKDWTTSLQPALTLSLLTCELVPDVYSPITAHHVLRCLQLAHVEN